MKTRGPLLLALFCLAPVGLWAAALPLDTRFADGSITLTSIAVVFGLAGFSSYALNLVLGARIKMVSRVFGGLEAMYAAHRANGRIAFVLLAAHGLLIIASRAVLSADDVARLFDASAGLESLLGVIALVLMSISIGATLYARLSHETFVYVQRALGVVFVIAAAHVFLTPGTKAVYQPLETYLVAIAGAGLTAFAYRSLFGNVLVRRHIYKVVAVDPLDPQVVEITMAPSSGRHLDFVPGQFVYVTFYSDVFNAQFHPFSITPEGSSALVSVRPGDIRNQFHPFSITSGAGERNLRIAVKAVGDYTTAMRRLDAGAAARVEGPYGTFSFLNLATKRQVWIAGGIGITPFLSMARSLPSSGYEIDLFFGAKSIESSYFLDELLLISEQNKTLRVIPFPEDKLGLLTADYIDGTTRDLPDKEILLCGPPVMIETLRTQLIERGIAARRIHFERFGFGPA